MNILKFAFALLALMISGQIMAWTEVVNDADYDIRFAFRQDMVDDKCWQFGGGDPKGWRIIKAHESYRTDCGAVNTRHEFYWQVDQAGDGNFRWPFNRGRIDRDHNYNESDKNGVGDIMLGFPAGLGNMRFTIYRDENGRWKTKIERMATQ